ncbi:tissue factor-like [Etheostoma cragini]|uniref:tissue factor-like n=1 Tax=Etheostoma cragini TaxID=417921 RepID=UPI00155E1EBF|nr:tissue factor-like [Etheostoma cragini]XP_034743830.1 tissue factor-like [Etheostoma cragini]
MASLKTLLWLGVCLSAWIITTADESVFKAENVRWFSLDFKTILRWTTKPSDHKYTALYSSDGNNWLDCPHCTKVSDSECDLTAELKPFDRTYTAKVQTEPLSEGDEEDPDEFPHADSLPFNPYRESNISAAAFTVKAVDKSRVNVSITDPLTSIHAGGKQLSIRDILKKDLKYKISYHKSGSTGKRDILSDSITALVSNLDAGQSYCFMVAAFIPSRPKATQQGAWSPRQCTLGDRNSLEELSLGTWVGIAFVLLTVLITIVMVTVLCCRCRRQRNTSQSSAPV